MEENDKYKLFINYTLILFFEFIIKKNEKRKISSSSSLLLLLFFIIIIITSSSLRQEGRSSLLPATAVWAWSVHQLKITKKSLEFTVDTWGFMI